MTPIDYYIAKKHIILHTKKQNLYTLKTNKKNIIKLTQRDSARQNAHLRNFKNFVNVNDFHIIFYPHFSHK